MTKTPDLRRLFPALYQLLLTFLFSCGLVLPLLSALSLSSAFSAVSTVLFTGVILSLLFSRRLLRLTGALLLLGALAFAFFSGLFQQMGAMLGAAVHLFQGNPDPILVYSSQAAVFLGAALTLVSFAVVRQKEGIYSAGVLFATCLLLCWFAGGREELILFVPALTAMGAMLASTVFDASPSLKTLTVCAAVSLCSLGLASSLTLRSQTLEQFAKDLRTYIYDTLFFTQPRTVYSIEADGYQPLDTRLGGAVEPADSPVMIVETDRTLYLRGAVKNYYSGLSWVDSLSTRRFLYSDFRYRSLRADMLDWDRPEASLRNAALFETYPVTVSMYANSASTLFAAARAADLSTPMALVPYFNASGELFITRDLAAGDTYSFSAPVISSDDERLPALLSAAAASVSPADKSEYMNVPDAVADDVRTLAQKLVQNCTTPLEKARAIQTYLLHNFEYTLSPETPPDQQDFVSYFLLRGEEGYCTYFASAMAVLGRLAGLPTRYVEGYLARPADGIALVTSKDAHAWTEVWFDGFGWLTFDATPADPSSGPQDNHSSETPPSGDSSGDSPEDSSDAPSSPPDGPDASGDEPTPPPPEDDSVPSEQEPSPTPSPSPSPEPSSPSEPPDSPTPPPNPPEDSEDSSSPLWWILLLALLVLTLIGLRVYQTLPATALSRCANENERLLTWYRLLLGLLAARRLPQSPCESPVSYADRIHRLIPREAQFSDVAECAALLGYSRMDASSAQVDLAQRCYRTLLRSCHFTVRVKWFLRRLFRGVGSIRQIP